ncbi:ankyrin repeat-containing domain protein [Haematococcus lacustris]
MGNSSSFEERVYDAAASNDATTLQVHTVQKASEQACRGIAMSIKLLEQMQSQQPAVGRGLLAFRDGDGLTPLMVATAKNHLRCVQLLLQHGARVDYVDVHRDEAKKDTALHMAARNGDTHAPVCDLLLRYGANPFKANSAGRTPLEEAMLAGSFAMMDKMWHKAIWLGTVAMKDTCDGEYKDRYVAVSQPNRWGDKQIYVRQDTRTLNPMFRGSLSGSKCFWATSTDVILRMHPVCNPSGDFTTHCERSLMYGKECWCLSLRPVSSSPAALADLDALLWQRGRAGGGAVTLSCCPHRVGAAVDGAAGGPAR